jgi:hypothetical protein
VRQVLGAIAEFEKTTLVAKLAAARRRRRKHMATGDNVEGRRSHTEVRPECRQAGEGARSQEAKGRETESPRIAAEMAARGVLNERGKPFNPKFIASGRQN